MDKDKILLFIPMYNCEKQITRVLEQLNETVTQYLDEVIIVNNRSTDNVENTVISYLQSHDISSPVMLLRNDLNYGLGGSHKVAFRYAAEHSYDYIIVLHGDDQGHIEDIIPYLESGIYRKYDCFLGARFMKGATLDGYSEFRTFGNRVYNLLFSLITGMRIYDLGSGLNLYKLSSLKSQFYLTYKDGLVFNSCMILGASYLKHKVRFFPIRWSEDDQVSNVKIVRQAVTILKLLGSFWLDKKGFMKKEHRNNAEFAYTAETVFQTTYSGNNQ